MKTANTLMKEDMEAERLNRRDYAVALSVAHRVADEYKLDKQRWLMEALMDTAYTAIRQERELHAGDMALLKQFMETRLEGLRTEPPFHVVMKKPD